MTKSGEEGRYINDLSDITQIEAKGTNYGEKTKGGLGNTPSLISSTYGKGWGLVTINTALHLYYSEGGENGEPIKGDSTTQLNIFLQLTLLSEISRLCSVKS